MLKQVLHKLFSVIMALLLLLSTVSFTVDKHFCGDTLVETAIFHKAVGCGMEMTKPSSEGCSIIKKNCCNDEQIVVDGQDELNINSDTLSFDQQRFVASFLHTYINSFQGLDENITSYRLYKPPLVIRQLYKLDETYII